MLVVSLLQSMVMGCQCVSADVDCDTVIPQCSCPCHFSSPSILFWAVSWFLRSPLWMMSRSLPPVFCVCVFLLSWTHFFCSCPLGTPVLRETTMVCVKLRSALTPCQTLCPLPQMLVSFVAPTLLCFPHRHLPRQPHFLTVS